MAVPAFTVELRVRTPEDLETLYEDDASTASSPREPGLDVRTMRRELHRMKLELMGALEDCRLEKTKAALISRNGSVVGRSLHVMNTVRHLSNKSQWKKDYIAEESGKVILYITSCGVVSGPFERCKEATRLLRALGVQHEIRDVYLEPKLMAELLDRMQLDPEDHKELVFDSLPMIFVNGRYFGNDATLHQENEAKSLRELLHDFQGRIHCGDCAGVGYMICAKCRGGKKMDEKFAVRLRCAACNANGIAPCLKCSPKRTDDD